MDQLKLFAFLIQNQHGKRGGNYCASNVATDAAPTLAPIGMALASTG
jgi:hypothetical protein